MTLFEQLGLGLGLGLLIGLQRQRATGKIAGIRTFPLIALLGVLTGRLADSFGGWVVGAGLLGVAGMILIGNLAMLRRDEVDPGITTEVAGLVMFVVGAALAAGLVAESIVTAGTVSLLLHWKKPLHRFADRIGTDDFRALIQLVLLALVILPVLPDRPYGPFGVLNPFEIWLMVVLIVGISLIAYVAYKLLDARLGTVAAGVLGGMISSTAATIGFARRGHDRSGGADAASVAIALASVAVFVRVLLEIAVVAPTALAETGPPLVAMMLAMLAISGGLAVTVRPLEARFEERRPPSNLGSAIAFGALYAAVLFAVAVARERLGPGSLFAVAAVSGLTDMDAITLSTARLMSVGEVDPETGWRIILTGGLANLVFKGGIVAALGSRRHRALVGATFGLALAVGGLLVWLWPG